MKNLLFLILFSFIFVNSVLALDCQYKLNESYEVEGFYFKEGSNYLDYKVLEILDFQQSSRRGDRYITYSTSPTSFSIKNNYQKPIEFYMTFIMDGEEQKINQTIDSGGFKKIEYAYPNSIDNSTFKFEIISPSKLEYLFEKRVYQKEVCKRCENQVCLNDGYSCNSLYDDSKCGSGICNIAGFCGSKNIVDCPNGKLNCQDKICLESSTKEEGESYMCSFECKSDRFEKGICLKSSLVLQEEEDKRNKNFIIFGSIILIVFSILVGKFAVLRYIERRKEEEGKRAEAKKQREDEERRRDKAKEEYDAFVNKKKKLDNEITNLEIDFNSQKVKKESTLKEIDDRLKQIDILFQERIDKLNKDYEKEKKPIEEEISRLNKERKNAKTEAQRIIDKELRRYNDKLIMAREETNREIEKQRLAKEEAEKERRRYQEEKLEIERTKPEREIELLENEYKNEYETGGRKIKFDKIKQRFFITSLYGKDEPLSRYVYEKRCLKNKKIGNKEIHHINRNQKIDRPENLIALSIEDHEKILEENIIKDDWSSGIKEIRRALVWKNSDFPEHIQQEIRRKDEISKRIARKSVFRRRG